MQALIVDQSVVTRSALAQILSESGFTVRESSSTRAALLCLSERPDIRIVIADWHVPGGGSALVRAIRQEATLSDVRFVALLTEAEVGCVGAGIEAGIDEYLIKPFSPDVVREKLDLLGVMAA